MLLFVLSTAIVYAQDKEVETYKSAAGIKEPILKIEALKNFVNAFPKSNYSRELIWKLQRIILI